MPTWLHITLAIIFTVYFLYKFIKERFIYELLFVIWVPSTLLTYVTHDVTFIRWLGYYQIVLFFLVIFFMFKKRGARREKTFSILAKMATDKYQDDEDTKEIENINDTEIEKNDLSDLK